MNTEEITEKVKKIIYDDLGVDEEVKPENSISSLGIDSLDAVEFSMDLEKEFNINIGDDEFEKMETIQDIINLVDKKLQGKE